MSPEDPEDIERKDRKAHMVRQAHHERPLVLSLSKDAGSAFPVGLAVVFLILHLPYLPASLEDLDSINFALGIRHFDVAHHQPHPPGYPVFMLIAKAMQKAVSSEATALGLVSIVAGTLGVLAMAALYRRLNGPGPNASSLAAVGVAMTSPLYWFTAVRPLSDVSGLAAALAVQAMTLGATSTRALAVASFSAGVAAGLRSQVVWLTMPLLIARGLGTRGLGTRGQPSALSPQPSALSPQSPASSPQSLVLVLAAFVAGVLLWFVPLLVVSGGPLAYWRALFNQGAEDLGNIQMLWTAHGARDLADALYFAFVAPWAAWPVASVVLVSAAVGARWSYRHARHALFAIAAGFGPYLVFDLLFQEAFTSRYALPLVIPVAYLAVAGTRVLPRQSGLVLGVGLAMFDAHVGGTSIAAYARLKAPAFRLLDDMRSAARATREPPVLAMDRREDFDFRRPIAWVGDARPPVERKLPAPPQHEWLEPVKYWAGGGRAPVWFVVDPMRTTIDLVQHEEPVRYRWPLPYPVLVGGARPNEMDWYRVDRPEWFVGEGWSLTPEAAGVAEGDRRDLSHGPVDAWIHRDVLGTGHGSGVLMIGGRSFDPALQPRLSVDIAGRAVLDETLRPGSFLRFARLPLDVATVDYPRVTVRTTPGARVAIEQFDASATRTVFGFGEGWHEQEFNPRTGLRWRWLSERGDLQLRASAPRVSLHVEGESPRKYFSRGSRFVIRSSGRIVFDRVLTDDFSLDVPIRDPGETIVLETDQVYVPAERSRRTEDRRHLGLRIFKCEIRRP
ncbi:MAG: hypothetical protein DMF95_32785 [Acidobacteria bacterium]|nr:MAG: hypothetical protein DMF95_32785 [Acidobacteriota bacterium]